MNRDLEIKDKILTEPFFKNTLVTDNTYPAPLYLDDFINPSNLIVTKDFSNFPLFSALNNLEDSYESAKFLNYFNNNNNKISLNAFNSGLGMYSYSFVFDMFRSNYDEFG